MIYVGVDPGAHTGYAAVEQDGSIRFLGAVRGRGHDGNNGILRAVVDQIRVPASDFLFAVEDQEYRKERSKGSPAQLFPVAQVAGAAFAALAQHSTCRGGRLVVPTVWKGSVPKLQHHRRLLTKLGWKWYETDGKEPYCIPDVAQFARDYGGMIRPSDWPEVLDALGIALWLREQHNAESF